MYVHAHSVDVTGRSPVRNQAQKGNALTSKGKKRFYGWDTDVIDFWLIGILFTFFFFLGVHCAATSVVVSNGIRDIP